MCPRRLIILLISAAGMINACTYSDYGTHVVEPVAGDPPTITASTNLDTLLNPEVSDSLKVVYEVVVQNGTFYLLDATVGNSPVFDSDTSHGTFWLYPNDVQVPGVDTLTLLIYYSSNTNSLADVLGIEALYLRLNYAIDFKWTPL